MCIELYSEVLRASSFDDDEIIHGVRKSLDICTLDDLNFSLKINGETLPHQELDTQHGQIRYYEFGIRVIEPKQRLSLEFEKRQTKHNIYDVKLLEIVFAWT